MSISLSSFHGILEVYLRGRKKKWQGVACETVIYLFIFRSNLPLNNLSFYRMTTLEVF